MPGTKVPNDGAAASCRFSTDGTVPPTVVSAVVGKTATRLRSVCSSPRAQYGQSWTPGP